MTRLRPIGHEYWSLSASSRYETKPFTWIWLKYRVTSHEQVMTRNGDTVTAECIKCVDIVEMPATGIRDISKQQAIWDRLEGRP